MAEKKIIDVEVRESGIDELNKKLEKTEQNLKDVDRQADKTETSIKDVGQNGGAIATLDELTGGLATKFKNAAEAAKLFGNSTKTALIATGIGAFVVALGLVVAYWEDIKALVTGVDESLEGQLNKSKAIAGVIEAQIGLLDEQLRIAKEQGTEADELLIAKRELLRLQLTELDYQRINLENQLAIAKADARRLTFWEMLRGAQATVTDEETQNIAELEIALASLEVAYLKAQEALRGTTTTPGGTDPTESRPQEQGIGYGETPGVITGLTLTDLTTFIDIEAGLIREAQKANTRVAVDEANKRVEIAEYEKDAKLELMSQTAMGIFAFADLVGQSTAAGKAFAVAATLIDTYAAISKQLRAFAGVPIPGYAIAQAIATGAVGLAQVKNILAVQTPNTNLSSSFFGSAQIGGAGAAVQQPSFNIIGDSGQNQLIDTIRGLEDRPLRAYVVQDDVRSAGELDRRIRASASIG